MTTHSNHIQFTPVTHRHQQTHHHPSIQVHIAHQSKCRLLYPHFSATHTTLSTSAAAAPSNGLLDVSASERRPQIAASNKEKPFFTSPVLIKGTTSISPCIR